MKNAKVMIAVPNMGGLHADLVQVLLRWHVVPTPGVEEVALLAPRNIQPHDAARNWCVKKFLEETESTHLFFIDSDVIPPKDALEKLVNMDAPVAAGAYPIKKFNTNEAKAETVYALFNRDEEDGGLRPVKSGHGINPIEYAGTGCLMIKREVFDILEKPYFKWEYDEEGLMKRGEDMYFSEKLLERGVPMYANLDVICQHSKEILL